MWATNSITYKLIIKYELDGEIIGYYNKNERVVKDISKATRFSCTYENTEALLREYNIAEQNLLVIGIEDSTDTIIEVLPFK